MHFIVKRLTPRGAQIACSCDHYATAEIVSNRMRIDDPDARFKIVPVATWPANTRPRRRRHTLRDFRRPGEDRPAEWRRQLAADAAAW